MRRLLAVLVFALVLLVALVLLDDYMVKPPGPVPTPDTNTEAFPMPEETEP